MTGTDTTIDHKTYNVKGINAGIKTLDKLDKVATDSMKVLGQVCTWMVELRTCLHKYDIVGVRLAAQKLRVEYGSLRSDGRNYQFRLARCI